MKPDEYHWDAVELEIILVKRRHMNSNILHKHDPVVDPIQDAPAVSIIMPFEPMMVPKAELELRLKHAAETAEAGLLANYSFERTMPVIVKLRLLLLHLNYNSNKKSIVIFVSPFTEQVYYLGVHVEEKVIVDESFEIRDLIYNKKQDVKYLVLLLSAESSRIYLGNCSPFQLIKANVPDNILAYKNDIAERVANFSDPVKRKEILLEKFLHHMDQGLKYVLHVYNLPVFVLGAEKVLGYFKKISKNREKLAAFIHGNYVDASEADIRKVLQPYLKDWRKIKEQTILQEVERANDDGKLASGIENVYAAAMQNNSRLLVVEKDFTYPAHLLINKDKAYQLSASSVSFYIKDVVDNIIEKVLKHGGDVEFIDDLQEHEHIALIQYY
ncbi:MAG TPA: hypothetical protein VEV83_00450 [Parafilimonas sp.]|nr:hypothetical protein [Parafilimonas sp.]